MPEQLALDIPEEETVTQSPETVDLAVSVIAAFDGDALAAIRNLLADADFLRDQLYTASCVMSAGMTRGWKPKYERP
nr:dehydrogenase [Rhizobium sp. Khangiran2]